jgi:hypothetical protein
MGRLNKSAPEGMERYRSAGQTNARDITPNLKEDVIRGSRQDLERIGRGMSAPAASDWNRRQQQEAGGKALTRMASRAGLAGTALLAGYDAGRAIDEDTGLGKAMVDKSGLGDLAAKAATPNEKVELSEESKARIARGDLDEKPKARASRDSEGGGGSARSEAKSRALMENREPKDEAMKRGGKVKSSASKRADGIATKGFTKGKYL